jgi:D-arabinose 1-dehydrogenase-like Zn-dependent alcohol dehydrogenase
MAEGNYLNTFEVLGDRAPKLVDASEADGFALGFDVPKAEVKFFPFKNPDLLPTDMRINVTHCGLCASDAHKGHGEWGLDGSCFPLVPGHEIVGVVTEMGEEVKGFEVG